MVKERRASPDLRLTVLYDGRCRACTRIAGRLAGLDAGRQLRLVPFQWAAADRPEVQRLRAQRDLRRALHVVDSEGRWASGGEAVLWTMDRLPVLRPLARVARLPLVSRLVEPGYRLVADHRARFAWLAGSFGPAQSIGAAATKPPAAGARRWTRDRNQADPGACLVDGAAVRAAVAQETLDLADEFIA